MNGTAPAGTQPSILTQHHNFVGLGTSNPEGPLEVVDQGSNDANIPDVANVVVTTISNPFVLCQEACQNCPPIPACHPINAFVVRSKNFNMNGDFTGYATKMLINRQGSIGINNNVLSNSGLTMNDRSLDILRKSSGYNYYNQPKGINFRDDGGTTNHTISTDIDNVLTIKPGVDGASSNTLHVAGKLWIGTQQATSSFANYALSVDGDIVGKRCVVQIANWADDVFDTDYRLLTLPELSSYIATNHHLPNVPTTEEVKKNGADVGEMNAILLRKVEELTLYVLALKKENEEIHQRVNRLEGK